jgi:hypothetical protein
MQTRADDRLLREYGRLPLFAGSGSSPATTGRADVALARAAPVNDPSLRTERP